MSRLSRTILVIVMLMMFCTGSILAEAPTVRAYGVKLSGDNHLTMFQGSTGLIAVYVHVTGNGAQNDVELLVHGKRETVTGNGTFAILITPGNGGKIMGQVIGSDTVEESASVELGEIKMVPVPSQLITGANSAPGLGLPEGVAMYMSDKMIPSNGNPGKISTNEAAGYSCGMTLLISNHSGFKTMYLGMDNQGAVNSAVASKELTDLSYHATVQEGEYSPMTPSYSLWLDRFGSGTHGDLGVGMSYMDYGIYNLSLYIRKTNNKIYGPIAFMPIELVEMPDDKFHFPTMARSITVTQGMQYQLARNSDDRGQPDCKGVVNRNAKIAELGSNGVLTAKKPGTTIVQYRERDSQSDTDIIRRCKVTVVINEFTRTKPLVRAAQGIYTSTKRLYYRGGALNAEVFIYNRTPMRLYGCDGYVFRLYEDDQLLYEKPLNLPQLNTPIKTKNSRIYKVRISDAALAGVSAKRYDLASGRIHAVIVGTIPSHPATPLIKGMDGAVSA